MYQFSLPMPYTKEDINKLVQTNNEIKKSRITSLYFSLPSTSELYTGFEQPRNYFTQYTNYEYWEDLIKYSIKQGFDITYNFNIALPVQIENPKLNIQLDKLDKLLSKLSETGVYKLRLYNIQLLQYIQKHYPEFELNISTVANYSTIQQFKMIKELYPNVKQVVPSQYINKNFKLLDIVRNKLNIDLEIMCNDGCLQNCINFYNHHGMSDYEKNYFENITCLDACNTIENRHPFEYLCQSNHVFPWELEEYAKIGITKFKLTGRDSINNTNLSSLNNFVNFNYLKAVDDIKILDNFPLIVFCNNCKIKNKLISLTCKDIKKILPNIKHFKKYGHLCASRCGVECRYCHKCAEKIQRVFEKKQEEQKKRNIPVCYFK